MGLRSAWDYVLVHIRALPVLFFSLYFGLLNKISPKLLDRVISRSKTIPGVKPSEKANFVGTTALYWECVKDKLADMRKKARLNEEAPNPKLYNLKNKTWGNLLKNGGCSDKPLAVIFGSCT